MTTHKMDKKTPHFHGHAVTAKLLSHVKQTGCLQRLPRIPRAIVYNCARAKKNMYGVVILDVYPLLAQ
jgi:hypothetical protein